MNGLAAYNDESDSGNESQTQTRQGNGKIDKSLKAISDAEQEPRRTSQPKKSQIIIKRPQRKPNTVHHPRGHISDDIASSSRAEPSPMTSTPAGPSTSSANVAASASTSEPEEELKRIRSLLVPPPIPDVADWGIPPEPALEENEPCDPAIEAKVRQFHALKYPSAPSDDSPAPTPRHFNDSLMSNRSFRNPHLYAQLVDFIGADERSTNFPKSIWDPYAPLHAGEGWDAEKIAAYQKKRSEQQAQAQAAGKRSHIHFQSSSTSQSHNKDRDKNARDDGKYNPYAAVKRSNGAALGSGRSSGPTQPTARVLGGGRGRGLSRWN
ncbi:hypothetical protein D9758_004040 [Tetrapyrgos nigripes]|uniref:HCNGP-domain-containing protein n=1 Tax=Tetrapyrgos nigripes TaxID=182062 RepID=A0A8H5LRU9_9AGAR|nr:hypothetical protein D9758_004040 [Tetrapyrgos nigripes]